MTKFRKKPVVIDATQWFKNGDHPQDDCKNIGSAESGAPHPQMFLSEGKIVRYYRNPNGDGNDLCQYCKNIMHIHGWIDTLEGGHIVCPGDWIITGVKGEHYPCKPDIFKQTYESELTFSPPWVKSSDRLPEYNVSVLVFIPEEDCHCTTGMYDISNKWVLLDEYRVPKAEVTYWRPMVALPEDESFNKSDAYDDEEKQKTSYIIRELQKKVFDLEKQLREK